MGGEQTHNVTINGHRIGPGEPTYIIAELSANHNHDLGRARELVHAAADSGADAIKLQTYTPDTITIDADGPMFELEGTIWAGKTLHSLYQEAYMPWEWHAELFSLAAKLKIDAFSSPFDFTAVDFLEKLDVPAFKIASSELVDIPLIRRVAQTGKPVILSTGMGTRAEIDEAVAALRGEGCEQLILLKCTAAYPAPADEANLATIPDLARVYNALAGLSDHTVGTAVPVAAVTLGACLIEKHFTLSRDDGGPDASFSLEPQEFAAMVRDVRTIEAAIGRVSVRADGEGMARSRSSPVAFRGGRHQGWRRAHPGQHPLDPARWRAAHAPL